MVKLAVFLDDQCGMEILSIGREGLDREQSCTLVARGKWLEYQVKLDSTFVFLKVAIMDEGREPELLLTVSDIDEQWRDLFEVLRALEREEVSLVEAQDQMVG